MCESAAVVASGGCCCGGDGVIGAEPVQRISRGANTSMSSDEEESAGRIRTAHLDFYDVRF